ncbi:hypothetical protein B0T24DRAFT_422014 [Lasiosphaeria ovina]|uniref:Ankyrin repeat protein n=1 Tax=Lasiosphaeria ovina TaxID=92902 RepID=A0AAE0JVY9_9PEZI|nr:hypothetical protein B0T24DRAFT_422014 [Lasiosphaeria ovina]
MTAREKGSLTPLHSAAASGHKDTVRLLLERGADATATENTGQMPQGLAAMSWHDDTAECFSMRVRDMTPGDRRGEKLPVIRSLPATSTPGGTDRDLPSAPWFSRLFLRFIPRWLVLAGTREVMSSLVG